MGSRPDWDAPLESDERPDPTARIKMWVWISIPVLLALLVGFWLVRAVPEEYEKLRAKVSDETLTDRTERMAAAIAQYHRHTGRYPSALEDLVATDGPEGYQGPYLSRLPANPATGDASWDYDPDTGEITDPTGRWARTVEPPSLEFSDTNLDWGVAPLPEGRSIVAGGPSRFDPRSDRPVLIHYFGDNDAHLLQNLRELETLAGSGTQVAAVLVRAERTSPRSRASVLGGLDPSYPVLDATDRGDEILAAIGSDRTPITLLADGELSRRARLHGPVTPDALDRAMDQVWDVYEAARMGQVERPAQAPDLEPEPPPDPGPPVSAP